MMGKGLFKLNIGLLIKSLILTTSRIRQMFRIRDFKVILLSFCPRLLRFSSILRHSCTFIIEFV